MSYFIATQLIEKGINKIDITVVDYNSEKQCRSNDSRISINREYAIKDIHSCNYIIS
jgi:hypothetical protein